MLRKLDAVVVSLLLLAGIMFGQRQTDWISASNNPDIQYRAQLFDDSKACYLEYRDRKQGKGYTTFDVAVDYKSTDSNSDNPQSANQPSIKTDTEHIVTASSQNGSSRISDCSAIVETRVNYVLRH